jgi:hypothetical protein
MDTAAAVTREGRSLELRLGLAIEGSEEVCGRLGGELVVPKADADGTTSQLEPIHLFKGLLRLSRIAESTRSTYNVHEREERLLDKAVTPATTGFFLLQLDKLKLSERLEDIL